MNLTFSSPVFASSSFNEDFSSTTNIDASYGLTVDTVNENVKIAPIVGLDDTYTTLLSHLGSDAEITTPAIGPAGTVTGVTYSTGTSGDAAYINTGNTLKFSTGSLDLTAGTLSFDAKLASWTPSIARFFFNNADVWSDFRMNQETNGKLYLSFNGVTCWTQDSLNSYADDSWHHFDIVYNFAVSQVEIWIDGSLPVDIEKCNADPLSYPKTVNNLTVGYGGNALIGYIDEFRIMNRFYGSTTYPRFPQMIESESFDTGVSSPVWGDISWEQTIPSKTLIEFQVNTSNDGTTWDGWYKEGMVTLSFDDGNMTIYQNAYPVVNSHSFVGTANVITDSVAGVDSSRMHVSQLLEMKNNGWEIANHTKTHPTDLLTVLTHDQLVTELSTSKQYLIDNNLNSNPNLVVVPGNAYNYDVIDTVADYHQNFLVGGGVYNQYNKRFQLQQTTMSSNVSLATMEGYVDAAETDKNWIILNFHSICDSGCDQTAATFTALLDYIATKNVDVVTTSQGVAEMLSTNTGSQIDALNKRYIKYRAVLYPSPDGTETPILSDVKISAPAKIYKNIATTINSDGTFDHATWPQTTDTSIDNLTVTPNTGSVTVDVDTWNTSSDYYKKWTETGSSHAVISSHTVGDLVPGIYYTVKKNGSVWNTYQANGSGQITFNYTDGYSTITFEVSYSGGGGSMPLQWWNPPTAPTGGFGVSINNGAQSTNIPTVALGLKGGSDTSRIAISNFSDFRDAGLENYISTSMNKIWNLCWQNSILQTPSTCPAGAYTVYVKYYTPWGTASDVVSNTIVLTQGLSLQAQQPTVPSIPTQPSAPFTNYLSYPDRNADVKRLQIFLNQDPDTRLSQSGAGSPGNETNFFGRLTLEAVIKFQGKYAQDILAPWNLTEGTGFVGKTTTAKINQLLGF